MAQMDIEIERANVFWNTLEVESGIEVPTNVRNILRFSDYNDSNAFCQISDQTIKGLEEFAREVMKDMLHPDADLRSYYDLYHRCPEQFRFTSADKQVIAALADYVRSKPEYFWKSRGNSRANHSILRDRSLSHVSENRDDSFASNSSIDQPVPLNVHSERRKLSKSVRHCLLREFEEDYAGKTGTKVAMWELDIAIIAPESNSTENSTQTHTCTAKVKCVKCGEYITVSQMALEGGGVRWVLAEYREHVQSHSGNADPKSATKQRRSSARQSAQPSAKASKIDDSNKENLGEDQSSQESFLRDQSSCEGRWSKRQSLDEDTCSDFETQCSRSSSDNACDSVPSRPFARSISPRINIRTLEWREW